MAGRHCFSLLSFERCNFPAVAPGGDFPNDTLEQQGWASPDSLFSMFWGDLGSFIRVYIPCQADNSVSTRACSLYLVRRNCRAESASQTARWLMHIAAGLLAGLHSSLQSSRELHNYFMLPFGHLSLKFWSVSLDFVRTRRDVSWGFLPSPGMCNTLGVPRVGKHFPLLFVRRTL